MWVLVGFVVVVVSYGFFGCFFVVVVFALELQLSSSPAST